MDAATGGVIVTGAMVGLIYSCYNSIDDGLYTDTLIDAFVHDNEPCWRNEQQQHWSSYARGKLRSMIRQTTNGKIVRARHLKKIEINSFPFLFVIPSNIGCYKWLTKIEMQRCKIKSIPPEIGRLAKLQILNLHKNNIDVLPVELDNLRELSVLVVSGNKVQRLDIDFSKLKKLRVLAFHENPVQHVDSTICSLFWYAAVLPPKPGLNVRQHPDLIQRLPLETLKRLLGSVLPHVRLNDQMIEFEWSQQEKDTCDILAKKRTCKEIKAQFINHTSDEKAIVSAIERYEQDSLGVAGRTTCIIQ